MTCYIERRERNSFFPLAVPWPGNEVFGWISSSIEVVGSRIEGYTQDDAVPSENRILIGSSWNCKLS